jgi:POT family proton-dependent oligopeptide transporter
MSSALPTSATAGVSIPATSEGVDRAFFGHPRGLSTLFFTEMWERFSYYGMRAFLIFYMTASASTGGMGLDTATAAAIYGTYTAMVYLLSVPGGWIADRVLGQQKSVLYGGILISLGHFSLAVPTATFFYLGLVLIVLGTGLLKPNISVIVGQLYGTHDGRRDAGFSIFYMGINVGAFFGPIIAGFLAQDERFRAMLSGWGMNPNVAWHFGFGAAGVGMALGVVQYTAFGRWLGDAGKAPGGATTPDLAAKYKRQLLSWGGVSLGLLALIGGLAASGAVTISPTTVRDVAGYSLLIITVVFFSNLFMDRTWTPDERGRLWVIFVFFVAAAAFWSVFEQAGSTLNLFADRSTRNELAGLEFPPSWFQSLNAIFIVTFAPVFAWLWITLGAKQPASPTKFGLGLIGVGIGFLVLVPPARAAAAGGLVSPLWLTSVYLLHTFSELCLSPVGLSSMTKLAPPRIVGSMMGVWFLGASVGNFIAGQTAAFYESMPLSTLFGAVSVMPIVAGIVLLVLSPRFTRMMGSSR